MVCPSLVGADPCRYITLLTPEVVSEDILDDSAGKPEDGVDLRTLRAIRVLRPLKLVSGVPSKCPNPDEDSSSSTIPILFNILSRGGSRLSLSGFELNWVTSFGLKPSSGLGKISTELRNPKNILIFVLDWH